MTRVLVLYYSSYGHVERMAEAVADGARSVAGTEVAVKKLSGASGKKLTPGSSSSVFTSGSGTETAFGTGSPMSRSQAGLRKIHRPSASDV